MSWFQRVKDQTSPIEVGRWLGLEPGPMSSLGPCPVCRADERGDDDSRGPIGVGAKGGWKCFRCNAQGDVIELAAQTLLGVASEVLDGPGAEKVRTWFAEQGVEVDEDAPRSSRSGSRSAGPRAPSVAEVVHGKPRQRTKAPPPAPETEPPPGAPEGTYAWSEDLVPRCEVALWGPTPEAARARAYLVERRCLVEASLRALRVGLYVHPDGRPWVVEGRPVLVIPLQDAHARPVNVKFRSVPTPGTCEACSSEDGCKKCRGYRACRGRPLPLFGAHLLSVDRENPVVVVEGELDMIAMHSMGFRANIVSTTAGAGTSWSDEWLDAVEPYSSIIGLYDDDEAGSEGWAKASATLGHERCARAVPPGGKDANAVLIAGIKAGRTHREVAEEFVRALGMATPAHGMMMRRPDEYADDVETLIANPDKLRGLRTGSANLDKAIGGWRPGLIVVSGETGQGKAQPVDEPVLTPSGWRPIGDLRVGDPVLAVDGSVSRVTGVFPQGARPVARVAFNDGAWTRCDLDHLWSVASDLDVVRGRPFRTLTASEVALTLRRADRLRWRVPTVAPVPGCGSTLPIDPYILGVLLADGSLTNGSRFSSPDVEIMDEVERRLPAGHKLRRSVVPDSLALDCGISATAGENEVLAALRDLGLHGHRSFEKFIPVEYLMGTPEQRMDLLRGMMDSDGYVEPTGSAMLTTSSERLCRNFEELVWSLGGATRRSQKVPKYTYKGDARVGRLSYCIHVCLPPEQHLSIFSLPRKAARLRPRVVPPHRKIESVEPDGVAECVCIQVAHPSRLYVTRSYIVTHNTTFTTWATLQQAQMNEAVMITSFEQRPIGSVQKLLRCQVGGDFTHVSESTRRDALAALSELDLFILDHYGNIPLEKLVQAIKYAKRRMGVRFFMIDHLGFLIDPDSRDERLDIQRVMRALAILAKVESVVILLVCHVANYEAAPGKPAARPTMRNLKGGSAIRQDADEVIIVVAKPINRSEKREYPVTELHLDKVRSEFGTAGACVRLAFDPGSTSYADSWEETPAGEAGKIVPR